MSLLDNSTPDALVNISPRVGLRNYSCVPGNPEPAQDKAMNQHPFQLKPLLLAMTLALSLGGCSFFDDDDDQLSCPSGERPNAAGVVFRRRLH